MRLGVALAAALAVAASAPACRGRRVSPPPPAIEAGRFPHPLHTGQNCVECHDPARVVSGEVARPGQNDHAPCDRERCHRAEFVGEPGKLCKVCHARVAVGGRTTLRPYPPRAGTRAQASEFSHVGHLDFGAMERAVGFHVSCGDCHAFDPRTEQLIPPGHAVCGRCHAAEAAPAGAPRLDSCLVCHRDHADPPRRIRRLIVGDLQFAHAGHRTDRRGRLIACSACHTQSAAVAEIGRHEPPGTRECVDCHDDPDRTPPALAMRECQTCHDEKTSSIGSLPPRSHLPATERPADHTLAFRADHAREAERDSVRCARCHTFLSGSERDTCDECHQVMEPQSHTVTWREFDHGPEAAARSDGCAVCHGADYCVACHQVPPRSHQPLIEFGGAGGHAGPARLNPRACVTCHVVEFCATCHVAAGARRR